MAYSTINKPEDYFNTVLWSGNSTDNTAITTGHATDFIWAKIRGFTYSHRLADSVRGADKTLFSDLTNAESSDPCFRSFDNNGFTLGTDGGTNASSNTYVGWSWLAGGTASSNTDGSITSSVSASTTSGFSIVSYTGTGANATVGHGLSSAPKMVIFKNRDNGTQEWDTYHVGLTDATYFIQLNSTNAQSNTNGALRFNSTAPTSSVFSVGSATTTNESGSAMVAYCFAEKKGFSKFGSYIGNGNVDGTFVYTGFKPAMVILKRTDGAANWQLNDSARDTFNVVNKRLAPSASDAEATNFNFGDFLSNGFKIRQTDQTWNTSGGNYIYMAFAERSLVGTNNIPALAR